MRNFWRRAAKYRVISFIFLVSLAFIVGGWLWAYARLSAVPQQLILHFNDYTGINQGGGLLNLLGIALSGSVVVTVNFFIALELAERDWFWGKLVAASTICFALLLFVGFAAIISVN